MTDAIKIINKLLVKIKKEHNFDKYDVKIEPISSDGANFSSNIFNITLSKNGHVVHMFAKVAALGKEMRINAPKLYETEKFVYTKLVNIYEKIQTDNKVPEEHRYKFLKFYGCDNTEYEETFVFENLEMNGYKSFERFNCVDWPYAKSVTKELAKLHALSFAYATYLPEEFDGVLKELKMEWNRDGGMTSYFKESQSRALQATSDENKDKLQKFFERENFKFVEYFCPLRRPVLGHGDFRPSNLMHRISDDGTVDIKIVDLQTLQGSSPVVDLMYFIFTGSNEEFRAQFYHKLLDNYYTELEAAMRRLRLNPEEVYSREDFEYELKMKLPFGLTVAIFALPIVTVDTENAPQVNEDMDLTAFSIQKTSDLYTERLNGVINDYVKFGILK